MEVIRKYQNQRTGGRKGGYTTWTEFYTDTVVLYSSNDMGK